MYADPKKIVLEFGFLTGHKVVDMGSGAGHYAVPLTEVLGPTGKVYAVDLNEGLLVKLKNECLHHGRNNLEIILGNIEKPGGTQLRAGMADGAILTNILFQLDDPEKAAQEAMRIIRPGGKVCILEWADTHFLKEALARRRRKPVTERACREIFTKAGFDFLRVFGAGEHHYGLIFKKPLQ